MICSKDLIDSSETCFGILFLSDDEFTLKVPSIKESDVAFLSLALRVINYDRHLSVTASY